MSSKRLLVVTILSVLTMIFLAAFLLVDSIFGRDSHTIELPDLRTPVVTPPIRDGDDGLRRVEITIENVQAVIAVLERPTSYSRSIIAQSFWEGGNATFMFSVSIHNDLTSISSTMNNELIRRIIITHDRQYIWYSDEAVVFVGSIGSLTDSTRIADQWHMLPSYEDVLNIDPIMITDAGVVDFEGIESIFITYRSPLLGYLRTYYISIFHGLLVGAEVIDRYGEIVFTVRADAPQAVDIEAFFLPDGTNILRT